MRKISEKKLVWNVITLFFRWSWFFESLTFIRLWHRFCFAFPPNIGLYSKRSPVSGSVPSAEISLIRRRESFRSASPVPFAFNLLQSFIIRYLDFIFKLKLRLLPIWTKSKFNLHLFCLNSRYFKFQISLNSLIFWKRWNLYWKLYIFQNEFFFL